MPGSTLFRTAFITLLLALLASCQTPQQQNATITISNVTVIDAVGGVREGQTVVVADDEIVSVGPGAARGAGLIIDGTGRFLIPGLWDMHVHLTYDDRFTPIMPRAFLNWGITSVRDTGGMLAELLPVVEAMRAPGATAPRVYFSGPLLDGRHVVYDGNARPLIGINNPDPEHAARQVQRLFDAGVDFIKIYELVSPEVFAALVQAAHRLDLPVAAHVPLSMLASEAGLFVNSMEHLRNVELDCASNAAALHAERRKQLDVADPPSGHALRASLHQQQRLGAIAALDENRCDWVLSRLRNTIQVPTLRLNALQLAPPMAQPDWPAALAQMPASVQQDWGGPSNRVAADPAQRDLRFAKYSLDMIARMHDAGVPVGAGTDTPIGLAIPGYSLHRELELLVRAGLTPMEALSAATITPLRFLGLDEAMGTIQPGATADLVLLEANPLIDIRNTRSIAAVVSKGKVVKQPGAPR